MVKDFPDRKRWLEFDLAKFFAIFFMILVHVFSQISGLSVRGRGDSFQQLVYFLGGPLVAPIFMLAMGIGTVIGRHNRSNQMFKRGLKLFFLGYLLNFSRGVLPIYLGRTLLEMSGQAIPDRLTVSLLDYLLAVDIMIFAGLCFMLMALAEKRHLSSVQILAISGFLLVIGTVIGELNLPNRFLELLLGLFVYVDEKTSFPLFLWMIYPALGRVLGQFLTESLDRQELYKQLALLGLGLTLLLGFICPLLGGSLTEFYILPNYYQQSPLSVAWTIGLLSVFLYVYAMLTQLLARTRLERLVIFAGRHLNAIYIVHWLILPIFIAIFPGLTPLETVIVALLITGLSFFMVYSHRLRVKKRQA